MIAIGFIERGELNATRFLGGMEAAQDLVSIYGDACRVLQYENSDESPVVAVTINGQGTAICSPGSWIVKRSNTLRVLTEEVFHSLFTETPKGGFVPTIVGSRWAVCWTGDNEEIIKPLDLEWVDSGPMRKLRYKNGCENNFVKPGWYIELGSNNKPAGFFDHNSFVGSFVLTGQVKDV